jgi:hypothetical protein
MRNSRYKKTRKYKKKKTLKRRIQKGGGDIKLPIKFNKEEILKKMKQYGVIFGGTVRNSGEFIKKNLENIDKCGSLFKNYSVVIYENDSSDDTRQILNDNKKDNYNYIFEDNITEPSRTKRISHGRNKVLDKIRELNKDNTYQYMVILDLDDINSYGKFVDTIYTCFLYDDWNVLTGNQSGRYYDIYALRKKGDVEYDCMKEVYDDMNKTGISYTDAFNKWAVSKMKNYPQGELLEVDSAFGGIAIYKLASIPNTCKYKGEYDTGGDICEHVPFNKCLKDNGAKIYINTSFITN